MTVLSGLPNFGWLTSELMSRSSLLLHNSPSVHYPSSISKSSTLSFVLAPLVHLPFVQIYHRIALTPPIILESTHTGPAPPSWSSLGWRCSGSLGGKALSHKFFQIQKLLLFKPFWRNPRISDVVCSTHHLTKGWTPTKRKRWGARWSWSWVPCLQLLHPLPVSHFYSILPVSQNNSLLPVCQYHNLA